MINKTLESKFDSTDDPTRFTATITTNAIDRDGEVVIPAGMNSKEYERNPVLLYAHDASKPIGKMLGMRRNDDGIEADFALAPRPETHEGVWLPDTVAALMRFGALRGVSIGFAPQPGGMRVASKADTERYGTGVKRVFSKWTLFEVSVVSIPANQEALISAVEKGIVSSASVKALGLECKNGGGDPPAAPSERIEGSDENPEGSASGQRGGIEIDEATEEALQNKVDEHNEEHGDKKGKRVTLGMLKAVYRRGAGAFSTSHRPGMQRGQWAMARVNAFLTLVRRGEPEDADYTGDNDLLPEGHPRKSDAEKSASRYIVALTMQRDDAERTDALRHRITINLPSVEDQAKRLAQIVRAKATGKFRI